MLYIVLYSEETLLSQPIAQSIGLFDFIDNIINQIMNFEKIL